VEIFFYRLEGEFIKEKAANAPLIGNQNLVSLVHPIGLINDGKQPMILRFSKHSFVKKFYTKRTNLCHFDLH